MILGLALGILPIMIAIINGYLIGFVARIIVELGEGHTLWQLLPHGIFEIPAIIISIGLGIHLGITVWKQTSNKKKKGALKEELNNALQTFIYIILPLLITAAIIETILIFYLT